MTGTQQRLAEAYRQSIVNRETPEQAAERFLPVVEAIAAERAAEELRALAAGWDDQASDWYYANRHTHAAGINYVTGYEEGWVHAGHLATDRAAALTADRKGQ